MCSTSDARSYFSLLPSWTIVHQIRDSGSVHWKCMFDKIGRLYCPLDSCYDSSSNFLEKHATSSFRKLLSQISFRVRSWLRYVASFNRLNNNLRLFAKLLSDHCRARIRKRSRRIDAGFLKVRRQRRDVKEATIIRVNAFKAGLIFSRPIQKKRFDLEART